MNLEHTMTAAVLELCNGVKQALALQWQGQASYSPREQQQRWVEYLRRRKLVRWLRGTAEAV